jgi:hypothetical protein
MLDYEDIRQSQSNVKTHASNEFKRSAIEMNARRKWLHQVVLTFLV